MCNAGIPLCVPDFMIPRTPIKVSMKKKKRKGAEMGEDSGALYRYSAISQGAPQSVMGMRECHVRNDPFSICLRRKV